MEKINTLILTAFSLVTTQISYADRVFVGPIKYDIQSHPAVVVKVVDCDFGWEDFDSHNVETECHPIKNAAVTPDYENDLNYSKPVISTEVVMPYWFMNDKETSVLKSFSVDAGELGKATRNISNDESLFHNGQHVTQYYAIKFNNQASLMIPNTN